MKMASFVRAKRGKRMSRWQPEPKVVGKPGTSKKARRRQRQRTLKARQKAQRRRTRRSTSPRHVPKALVGFWARTKAAKSSVRLVELQVLANRPPPNPRTKEELAEARARFEKMWFIRRVDGEACFVCGMPADVPHHILTLGGGGPNIKENIVPLCIACHVAVHPHLKGRDPAGEDRERQLERAAVSMGLGVTL